MQSVISVILVTSLALFGKPAYAADREAGADEAPLMDPSKHIHIVYNKHHTPDSMVFTSLLASIQSFDETTFFGKDLEDWVYQEMNTTYSMKLEAWFMPRVESRRHSREDIQELADLLLDVTNKWYDTTVNAQQDAFCHSEKFSSMEQKLTALERRVIEVDVEADFYLNYTMEQISEQSRADLRAWISRWKQGFSGTRYNTRTMWAEHESMLDANFVAMCEAAGGIE
jgi:hypothetical protein